jgi:hypothetical protein
VSEWLNAESEVKREGVIKRAGVSEYERVQTSRQAQARRRVKGAIEVWQQRKFLGANISPSFRRLQKVIRYAVKPHRDY